jgi:hypothetical protein
MRLQLSKAQRHQPLRDAGNGIGSKDVYGQSREINGFADWCGGMVVVS